MSSISASSIQPTWQNQGLPYVQSRTNLDDNNVVEKSQDFKAPRNPTDRWHDWLESSFVV